MSSTLSKKERKAVDAELDRRTAKRFKQVARESRTRRRNAVWYFFDAPSYAPLELIRMVYGVFPGINPDVIAMGVTDLITEGRIVLGEDGRLRKNYD